MKYLKQFLFLILLVLFGIVVWYGFSEELSYLFILPVFAVGIFLSFYLSKEFEEDEKAQVRKGMQLAEEDAQAQKWVEQSLAPDTLKYITTRRWLVLGYCTIFFLIAAFIWSYLSHDLLTAVRDFTYAALIFFVFIMYVLITPTIYGWLERRLPKRLQNSVRGDWTRGYLFLLPMTFFVYLVYPFTEIMTKLLEKLFFFPLFFVVYTFAFVCVYCIVYMYQ